MTDFHPIQVAKRIIEAEGYLELGMPQEALERICPIDNAGQFAAAHVYLMGKAQSQSTQTASSSETATAVLLPTGFDSATDSECSPECEKALKACVALIRASRGGNKKAHGSGERGR